MVIGDVLAAMVRAKRRRPAAASRAALPRRRRGWRCGGVRSVLPPIEAVRPVVPPVAVQGDEGETGWRALGRCPGPRPLRGPRDFASAVKVRRKATHSPLDVEACRLLPAVGSGHDGEAGGVPRRCGAAGRHRRQGRPGPGVVAGVGALSQAVGGVGPGEDPAGSGSRRRHRR